MNLQRTVLYPIVFLLPILSISGCYERNSRLEAHFLTIKLGISADQVVQIMGRPAWDGRCGAKIPTGLPSDCAREMGYAAALAPIDPSYYLVWFGKDGRVVKAAPILSP